jgi:arabinofuranosyltransferase
VQQINASEGDPSVVESAPPTRTVAAKPQSRFDVDIKFRVNPKLNSPLHIDSNPKQTEPRNTPAKTAIVVALLVAAVCVLSSLWISDDAAITLRTVLNLVNGYGARFNIDERVQAYTHPLWFLLLSLLTLLLGNVYAAAWALGMTMTLLTLWLVMARLALSTARGIALVVVMLVSKSHFDFAVSGLENPLSHLLLVSIVITALRAIHVRSTQSLYLCFLFIGLTYLSRPDLVLLVAPLALYLFLRTEFSWRTRAIAVGICISPVIGWTAFSLIYYGFPFPNTAYAKLNVAIPLADRARQGMHYLADSFNRDPISLLTVAFAIGVAYRSAVARALAVGIVLYLAYVVSIGGDFMSGRFLSVGFVAAICILATAHLRKVDGLAKAFFVFAVALNIYSIGTRGLLQRMGPYELSNGISDERRHLRSFSLRKGAPGIFDVPPWQGASRSVIIACGGLGILGMKVGPSVHLIDQCALADALLARLPPKYDARWRPGHFIRQIPTDYLSAVRSHSDTLPDVATRELYTAVRSVTQAPLLSSERWQNIVRLNRGSLQLRGVDREQYINKDIPRISSTPKARIETMTFAHACKKWDSPDHLFFEDSAEIELVSPTVVKNLNITVDATDGYIFEYWQNGEWRAFAQISPQPEKVTFECQMVAQRVSLANPTPAIARIRVRGVGDQMYSISQFLINDSD